jgi:hypothetical protein
VLVVAAVLAVLGAKLEADELGARARRRPCSSRYGAVEDVSVVRCWGRWALSGELTVESTPLPVELLRVKGPNDGMTGVGGGLA